MVDWMSKDVIRAIGSYLGVSGIVLLAAAFFCALADRAAKLLELALVDVADLLSVVHTDRKLEHSILFGRFSVTRTQENGEVSGGTEALPVINYPQDFEENPYLSKIRGVKLHLKHWAKILSGLAVIVIAIASLAYGMLSVGP